MSGPADKGFGAHPFGEIARATVAATERALASQEEANKALRQSLEAYREGARGLREHGPGLERRLPAAARGGRRGPAETARAGVNHPSWVMPGGLGPGIVDP
ncbi:MAG TPA: hypothetical protein VG499_05665 [Actinomycetota bacterium]|nr:hypothetical protein [Actinomycetota bacterium]